MKWMSNVGGVPAEQRRAWQPPKPEPPKPEPPKPTPLKVEPGKPARKRRPRYR